MSITIIKGDLLEADDKYIAHACNATSRQASGLAYSLFTKFPYANIYKDRPQGKGFSQAILESHAPGNIIVKGTGLKVDGGTRFVVNCISMVYPGSPLVHNSLRDGYMAREKYFRACLMRMGAIPDLESIAFPYGIMSGLAGGDWKNYLTMLEIFDDEVNKRQKVKVSLYKKD